MVFLFLALAAILFNGAEPLELEGHPRNLPVKLFHNGCTGLGEVV